MKDKKNVLKTILMILILTFGAKVLGFARDMVLSSRVDKVFSDAYLLSLNSLIFFISIGTGIGASLIPIIVGLIHGKNKTKQNRSMNNIINILLTGSLIITLLGILSAKGLVSIMAPGYQGEIYTMTVKMTQIMFPSLIFIMMAYTFVSYLQAHERYTVQSFMSMPYNIVTICYLIFLYNHYGIYGLAVATLVGWILQWIIQMPSARMAGYRYQFVLDPRDESIKVFLKTVLPIVFVSAVQQINIIIDNNYTSHFGPGKVSAIYFANSIYLAAATLTVNAITSVMFPKFSKKFQDGNETEFQNTIRNVVTNVTLFLMGVGVLISVLAKPIITVIYMRGKFNAQSVEDTANVLAAYAIGMVCFAISDILNKAFFAIGNVKIPVYCGALTIGINIIFNTILGQAFGSVGIPIATTIAFIVCSLVLTLQLNRIQNGATTGMGTVLAKSGISAVVMGIVVTLVRQFLEQRIQMDSYMLSQIIILAICGGIGFVIYLGMIWLTREQTFRGHITNIQRLILKRR